MYIYIYYISTILGSGHYRDLVSPMLRSPLHGHTRAQQEAHKGPAHKGPAHKGSGGPQGPSARAKRALDPIVCINIHVYVYGHVPVFSLCYLQSLVCVMCSL